MTPGTRSIKVRLVVALTAATAFACVLALGVGEGVVRNRERHRTVVPGTMPTLFYRHTRLRHALVRDYSYFGWATVDSFGFRRTPSGGVPGARRPLVLVLGGSTTFDTQVSADDRAWPSRLETLLHEEPTAFVGDIVNGGVPGYRMVDILIRLETELANWQPDLILLYESHNDLYTSLGSRGDAPFSPRPGAAATLTPWTAWLEEHSLLYAKLAGRWQAMRSRGRAVARAAAAAAVPWDSIVAAASNAFARDVESIVAVAQARGIPIALMTVTHVSATDSVVSDSAVARSWLYTVSGAPAAVVLEGYRQFAERLRGIARRRGVPLIDGARSGVAGPALYAEGDPIHFNDAGAEQFARFVAGQVRPLLGRVDPERRH